MSVGMRNKKRQRQIFTNQIIIPVMTALLASAGSISVVYLSAPILVSQFIEQQTYDNKAKAYERFLRNMSEDQSSASIRLISINQMIRNISRDENIQIIEDNIKLLSSENNSNKLFFHLISNMQALSLHGSKKVDLYIDDFISVLLGNEFLVDWDLHDEDTKKVRNDWVHNNGPAYGFEEKVDSDERAKFIILSAQYVELVKLLKTELLPTNS